MEYNEDEEGEFKRQKERGEIKKTLAKQSKKAEMIHQINLKVLKEVESLRRPINLN